MSIELKPCPFCGGEAEMMGDQYPYVECHECGAGFTANHSYEFDEDDAASNWNTRRFGQDKMKRIAEKKIEQLGGDVCGVLVRTEGGVMAVSEHGRCTRLDAGVMGPVDGAQDGEWLIQMRGDYLKTRGVWERPDHRGYTNDINDAGRYSEEEARKAEQMMPEKCKAVRLPTARAQSGQGAEPVAWTKETVTSTAYAAGCAFSLSGDAHKRGWRPLIYGDTHPQPAQQGSVPEEAVSLARKWLGTTESSLLHNDDITKMAEALLATSQPAKQGVPEEEERLTDIYRRKFFECHDELNNLRSEYHNRTAELEGENEDLRQELQSMRHQPAVPEGWRAILEEALAMMTSQPMTLERQADAVTGVRSLLSTPTTPQADGWIKCSERLPTEADADSEGNVWFCWPDGDMRLVHYKKIQLPYHSEHHWKPTGLKRPQPPKEGA